MIKKTIWEILKIESTHDISLIKSAYAQQAKLVHPEDNPIGFQELREAYQVALRLASFQQPNNSDILVTTSPSKSSVLPIKEKSKPQYKTEIDFDDVKLKTSDYISDPSKLNPTRYKEGIRFKYFLEEFIYDELDNDTWERFIESPDFIRFISQKRYLVHFLNLIIRYKKYILLPQSVVNFLESTKLKYPSNYLLQRKIDKAIHYILIAQSNEATYTDRKMKIKKYRKRFRIHTVPFKLFLITLVSSIFALISITEIITYIQQGKQFSFTTKSYLPLLLLILFPLSGSLNQREKSTPLLSRIFTRTNLWVILAIVLMGLNIFLSLFNNH